MEKRIEEMYDVRLLIKTCVVITKNKGFDVSQHGTQLALNVTEIAEAMEHVTATGDEAIDNLMAKVGFLSENLEAYRKHAKNHVDTSKVKDLDALLEERADDVIRHFSYVGGNGYMEKFLYLMFA